MLGAVRHSFSRLSYNAFILVYITHGRLRLQFGGAPTFRSTVKEFTRLQKMQVTAARLVELRGLSYEKSLQLTGLFPA